MKNEKKELDKLERIGESMNVNKKTLEIWKRNLKQGYRFFQPHNAVQLTPRTLREADVQKNIIRLLQRTKTV
jgi:Mn-dependent DtxR family transcriptional regulator